MSDLFNQAVAFVKSPAYIDVTTRQLAILGVAMTAEEPLKVREMASALKLSKPVVTRALLTLERYGLVERRRGKDMRDRFIHVTSSGRAWRAAVGGPA